jgi:hypothetical protein
MRGCVATSGVRDCVHPWTKLPRKSLHAHAHTLTIDISVLGILQLKQGERSTSSFKASTKDLILDFPEQLNYEESWSTGTLRVLDDFSAPRCVPFLICK